MTSEELLNKVRKIEIKTRGLSKNIFAGEYHSQFKGRGMAFSEVREYQPGDDVRSIDWNVTARLNRPYIKVFEEERAQDWSPLRWTGWISLQSKGLSRVFSNTTVQKHQFFSTQPSSQSNSHIHT